MASLNNFSCAQNLSYYSRICLDTDPPDDCFPVEENDFGEFVCAKKYNPLRLTH